MQKMKPGAKVNAFILAGCAFAFAQQAMGYILKVVKDTDVVSDYMLATILPGAALVCAVLAIIKAIPQPIEEKATPKPTEEGGQKVGSDSPTN